MIHPASDCFIRNYNSALREQILDVTKDKREPEIEPDRLVNDLRREPISGVADFVMLFGYQAADDVTTPRPRLRADRRSGEYP